MKSSSFAASVAIVSLLAFTVLSASAGEKVLQNLDRKGVALQGYDPVAYFTENQAVKGSADHAAAYRGATYHFASATNEATFKADPAKYEPQFGGYCAWAVSNGYTAKIDPDAFAIVDGRLLLQYSKSIREKFAKDTSGNLKKADENWPKLVEKKGKTME